ncbi:flagellar basal body rod protein FlgC [Methylococcus sp. EFPC2]|uniref:flagellar basal body rod protein FlgC n=1 Tax=Methylococcus sp. EFPC2 TaxID=2812648 RepID=UPI001967F4A3|nr:flagellar basal body rod protein FlgC [Methylococcus sp. EFPC2]QSA98374.1 flagellar basal body rod protein FlgC [Methylococcus sp. EFPC2]
MSSLKVFDIAGSGMAAQNLRLNLVASNISNVDSVSSSINQVYRSRQPVFAAQLQAAMGEKAQIGGEQGAGAAGVQVLGVVESEAPPHLEYAPDHPLANEEGYIFRSNVNTVEELTNMIAASRAYQDNVEVANTAKQLMLQTLRMGQ